MALLPSPSPPLILPLPAYLNMPSSRSFPVSIFISEFLPVSGFHVTKRRAKSRGACRAKVAGNTISGTHSLPPPLPPSYRKLLHCTHAIDLCCSRLNAFSIFFLSPASGFYRAPVFPASHRGSALNRFPLIDFILRGYKIIVLS